MRQLSRRFGRALAGTTLSVSMLVFTPVQVAAETLADALIDAYKNSNLLDQNRALLRVADDDVAIALSSMLPTLDFIARFDAINPHRTLYKNPVTGRVSRDNLVGTFQLQAQIQIYAGGRNKLTLESRRETVLATREALRSLEQRVLLDAVRAYMEVLRAQAFVNLRENNVRVLGEQRQATGDRFDVGEVTRTDVALADSRLAAARSLLEASRGNLAVAREQFRTAVGRYPNNITSPGTLPQTAPSVQEAISVAVRTHPDIRQAQRQVTVGELGMRIAAGNYRPSVTAGVTAETNSNDQFQQQSLNVTVTQPLYQGGRLAALERQAIAQRDSSRANLLQTTLGIEELTGSAWANIEAATAQIRATELQIRAAEIAFEGTRDEAMLGARTTLDVLDSEQELLDARASRIDAIATQYVAVYSLLSAMGLMTVDHLNLGIQTYDPAGYYNNVKTAPARLSPRGAKLDRVLRKLGQQ
ncbi:MAG: TolC family outer membrane protein [Tropicimonas sp.]|uniref:TolC family outer membrane protein n=1 Tax=Tropicimonas sp. TaxID=2067044 RepID=UPI003A88B486